MREDDIRNLLKGYRTLAPRADFVARLRATLLASHEPSTERRIASFRRGLRDDLAFGTALVFSGAFLFLLLVGFSRFLPLGGSSGSAQNLNAERLLTEAQKLEFGIELGEAEYFSTSAEEVAALLGTIGGNAPERKAGAAN